MSNKGMALPIETIIVIILAVTVLTVLTTYFLGVWGEKTDIAKKLQSQLTGDCLDFITKSGGNCNLADPNLAPTAKAVFNDKIKKLCSSNTEPKICTGASDQECLRNCCTAYCR